MCRSSQVLGSAKDFFPNFPKLARKVFVRVLPTKIFSHKDREILFWCDLQKKFFSYFSGDVGRHFFKTNNVGRHFSLIFRDFAHIFRDFVQIFRDFAQIFHKSNFGGTCTPVSPPHTPLVTHAPVVA